jgi:hypothetical protein
MTRPVPGRPPGAGTGRPERWFPDSTKEKTMRRGFCLFAGLALAFGVVTATWVQGQVAGQAYYNPYNGASAAAREGYNPYTGTAGREASGYNPYTGRDVTQKQVYNPYTGNSATVRASTNPYTGRTVYAGAYRR